MFRVFACWWLYKRPSSSLLLLVFLEFLRTQTICSILRCNVSFVVSSFAITTELLGVLYCCVVNRRSRRPSNFCLTFVWHPSDFRLPFIWCPSNFHLTFVYHSSDFRPTSIWCSLDLYPTSIGHCSSPFMHCIFQTICCVKTL